MKRREFITLLGGAAAAWPLAARAQQAAMPVIGFLYSGSSDGTAFLVTAFRSGLKEAGYIEGRNVAVEYRWAESEVGRVPALVADLFSRQVAVIAADSRSTLIAKAATTTIPIVFFSGGDPVKLGFVTSLNRPGGNITGASFLTAQVAGKRLELLRELIPTATVIDYLVNPDSPTGQPEIADAETAARTHGLKLQLVNVVNARGEYDFDQAFATIARHRPDALFVGGDPIFLSRRHELVSLVARHAIPTNLQSAGICRGRRTDELRHQRFRLLEFGTSDWSRSGKPDFDWGEGWGEGGEAQRDLNPSRHRAPYGRGSRASARHVCRNEAPRVPHAARRSSGGLAAGGAGAGTHAARRRALEPRS